MLAYGDGSFSNFTLKTFPPEQQTLKVQRVKRSGLVQPQDSSISNMFHLSVPDA